MLESVSAMGLYQPLSVSLAQGLLTATSGRSGSKKNPAEKAG